MQFMKEQAQAYASRHETQIVVFTLKRVRLGTFLGSHLIMHRTIGLTDTIGP